MRKDQELNLVKQIQLMCAIGVMIFMAPTLGVAGDKTCIDRWSEAAPVVAAKRLVKVEELSALAPKKLGGSIVKATLCQEDGSYIYSLVLRTTKGKLKSVTVDARRPF